LQPGFRIFPQFLHASVAVRTVARRELAGIAALGVIGAADEAAELAELERKPPAFAARAFARIAAVRARRKEVRRQHLVERIDHLGDAKLFYVADSSGELAPEIAQQITPSHLVVRYAVELPFQIGREIVFHVAGKKA